LFVPALWIWVLGCIRHRDKKVVGVFITVFVRRFTGTHRDQAIVACNMNTAA
jgi:hypothetical protein